MKTRSTKSRTIVKTGLSLAKRQKHSRADERNIPNSSYAENGQDCKQFVIANIETRLKTPKSERKKEVHTPLHTDLMCSQHFDSQLDVGWDCNSPDTIRGLRKMSSDHETDIPDIFMKLIADEPDPTEPRGGTPPLLGIWRRKTEGNAKDCQNLRPRRRGRRKSIKDSVGSGSRDLLLQLSTALDKCSDTGETDERTAESSIRYDFPEDESQNGVQNLNNSDDLFDTTKVEMTSNVGGKQKLRVSPRLQEKNKHAHVSADEKVDKSCDKSAVSSETERRMSDLWSDDEFLDDSFIIKATQLGDDNAKFSPLFGVKRKPSGDSLLPKSKASRFSFQLGDSGLGTKQSSCLGGNGSGEFTSLSSRGGKNTTLVCDSAVTGTVGTNQSAVPQPPKTDHNQNITEPRMNVLKSSDNHCHAYPGGRGISVGTRNNCQSVPGARSGKSDPKINSMPTKVTSVPKVADPSSVNTGSRCSSTFTAVPSVTSASTTRNFSFRKHNSFSGQCTVDKSTCEPVRQRYRSGNVTSLSQTSPFTVGCKNTDQLAAAKSTVSKCSISGNQPAMLCSSKPAMLPNKSVSNCVTVSKPTTATTHYTSSTTSSRVTGSVGYGNLSAISEAATFDRQTCEAAFDTSLSDDLLFQLAEPDDILDSQICDITTTTINNSCSKAKPVCKVQPANANVFNKKQTYSSVTAGHKQTIEVRSNQKPPTGNHAVVQGHDQRATKPVTGQCAAKPVTGHCPAKPSSVPSARLPSGQTRPAPAGHPEIAASTGFEEYSEDLFTSDDDLEDASLADMMGDDGLTEPEILAMLDEAELLATQKLSSEKVGRGSDHGGSQGRLSNSQGRLSNSQGRLSNSQGRLSNSQGKQLGSQGQQLGSQEKQASSQGRLSNSQGRLSNSQGRLSNSQGKQHGSQGQQLGSQEKQASSQDCKQGHATSQGRSSSQGHSSQGQSSSPVQTASQLKYSPAEIERKKREALERRRLRATQKPPQDTG